MSIFNKIFLTALLAGGLAGLILAGVQSLTVAPMILEAETYEIAGGAGHHAEGVLHDEQVWAPEDGGERTFYTVINSVAVGVGFGLLLTACYTLRRSVTLRSGVWWGFAGFAVFHLAPALGLPPELPGDAAAGVGVRQTWWVLTVLATAIGLSILVFQPARYLKLAGVALIVLPHLFGAPQPEVHGGLAPDDLRSAFILTSLISNAIFWMVLGLLSAFFFNQIGEQKSATTQRVVR
ncbi:Predicted cobalt transporter CbtA [hydrothermal vent metagenome]|uniref:Predicted cobalt transporter CbtA n=1 Tax=hydrothermal vent metagenome TaxID=652676 RepID=A0A3B0W8J5_9ZZZZ